MPADLKEVDGQTFARLCPYCQSLAALIAHDVVDVPKKKRFSLFGTAGFKALLKLRNDTVAEQEKAERSDEAQSAAEALFGGPSQSNNNGRYKRRMNAAKLQ